MSKLSEEYLKILNDIDEHISDEDEKKYVLKKVSEIIKGHTPEYLIVILLNERQL